MATLNLNTEEFADVAMLWLLDQVANPEQITNERFAEFVNSHKGKLKSPLLMYFFDTPSKQRLEYKRISGVFDGSTKSTQQIRIDSVDHKKEKKKEGKLKKLAKAVIKKVLAKESLNVEEQEILKEIINYVDYEIHEEDDIQ